MLSCASNTRLGCDTFPARQGLEFQFPAVFSFMTKLETYCDLDFPFPAPESTVRQLQTCAKHDDGDTFIFPRCTGQRLAGPITAKL